MLQTNCQVQVCHCLSYLEVGGGFWLGPAARRLVQKVAEHVEQEKDGEQVQVWEEALEQRRGKDK